MKNPFWTFRNPVIWVFAITMLVAIGLNRLFEWSGKEDAAVWAPIALVVSGVVFLWAASYLHGIFNRDSQGKDE